MTGTSATTALTGGQTSSNSVPFATMEPTSGTDQWQHIAADVLFSDDNTLQVTRVGSTGDVNVSITVVQFDTGSVTVQNGTFSMTGGPDTDTLSPAVNTSRTALVFNYQSTDTADDYTDNAVRGVITSSTVVTFDVQGSSGTKSGNWYAFESLAGGNGDFEIQTFDLVFGSSDTSATDTLTNAVDMSKTFLMSSYITSESSDDARDGSLNVELTSTTVVTGRRGNGGTPSATMTASGFALTFRGDESVQRGEFTMTSGLTDTDTLTAVDLETAMPWNTVIHGRMESGTGTGAGTIIGSHMRLNITATTEIRGVRGGTAGNARGNWEVIEWVTNQPPSAPTNILCNNATDCDITVDQSVNVNATGSTDPDSDAITYSVEASLDNVTTFLDNVDVQKIATAGAAPNLYTINFDDETCANFASDNLNWTSFAGGPVWTCSDTTPSGGTGPSGGAVEEVVTANNNFIFTEVSSGQPCEGTSCITVLRHIIDATHQSNITFWYHMFGGNLGTLFLEWNTTGSWTTLFSITGQDADQTTETSDWKHIAIDLDEQSPTGDFGLRFRHAHISGFEGDASLDNVTVHTSLTGGGNDQNTTATEYLNIDGDFDTLVDLTFRVQVDSYQPNASAVADGPSNPSITSKPDLVLELWNGTHWVDVGNFTLPTAYTGAQLNNTNQNFTIIITDTQFIDNNAWNLTQNQDFRVKGSYLDFINTTTRDEINYTAVYAFIDGKRWIHIGNHSDPGFVNWDTSSIDAQTNVQFRARAIDVSGTNTFSAYFYKRNSLEISHGVIRTITEALSFSENALRVAVNTRTNTETLTFSEVQDRTTSALRTFVESITLSEVQDRITNIQRLQTETLTFSDVFDGIATIQRTMVEALTLSDATTRITSIFRTVSESLTFSDATSALRAFARTISESLTLADQNLRIVENTRVNVESLTFSDLAARTIVTTRVVSETLTFSEVMNSVRSYTRIISEALTLSDSPARITAAIRLASETLTFSDLHSRTVASIRLVSETLTFSEVSSRVTNIFRTITETLTFSESMVGEVVGAIIRTITESLTFADQALRQVVNIRLTTETLTFSEALSSVKSTIRLITESLTFSEQALRQVVSIRLITETLTFSEAMSSGNQFIRTITESLTLADQTTRTTIIIRTISETLSLSEVQNRIVSNIRQIAEALGFVDLFDGFEGVPAPPAAPEFGGDIFFIYERFFANEDLALVNVQLIRARLPHVVSLSDGCVVNDLRMNATLIQIDVEGSQCLLEILSRTKPLRVDFGNRTLGVEESPVEDVLSELNTPAWGYIEPRLHIRVPSEDHTPVRIAFDEDALLLLPIIVPLVINAGILFLSLGIAIAVALYVQNTKRDFPKNRR